jgi:hypothetical protein
MTIVNDDSRVINKLEASLTDDARVVIYDRHMLTVQATGLTRINSYIAHKACHGQMLWLQQNKLVCLSLTLLSSSVEYLQVRSELTRGPGSWAYSNK